MRAFVRMSMIATLGLWMVSCMPDLVVAHLKVDSWSSYDISYSYTVKNIGNRSVYLGGGPNDPLNRNVAVQAYLSSDTIFNNAGDIPAGGTAIYPPGGMLEPGGTRSGSFSAGGWSNPIDTKATPYLVLKVDYGNIVPESNENNNTLAVRIQQ